jgi:DNA-directed RNA polymerase specialized sigma24 family protein
MTPQRSIEEMKGMEDEPLMDLLKSCPEGDKGITTVWNVLCERHRDPLVRYLVRRVCHDELQQARDATESALEKVCLKRHTWNGGPGARFLQWLHSIAENCARDIWRGNGEPPQPLTEGLEPSVKPPDLTGFEELLIVKLRKRSVEQQRVIRLYYFDPAYSSRAACSMAEQQAEVFSQLAAVLARPLQGWRNRTRELMRQLAVFIGQTGEATRDAEDKDRQVRELDELLADPTLPATPTAQLAEAMIAGFKIPLRTLKEVSSRTGVSMTQVFNICRYYRDEVLKDWGIDPREFQK